MHIRECQIGMQGPQLCAGPRHFCKLDVPSSRIAFLDLKLLVLQLGTSNSNNWGRPVVQNCTSKLYIHTIIYLTMLDFWRAWSWLSQGWRAWSWPPNPPVKSMTTDMTLASKSTGKVKDDGHDLGYQTHRQSRGWQAWSWPPNPLRKSSNSNFSRLI